MEAEKLSRGMEGPARKDDGMEHEGLTSAGERPSAVDKRKFRSWAKKTFRRE